MQITYDSDADVLYITIREAESIETEHREDDVLIRRDSESNEIIGYTVIGFKSRDSVELPDIAEMPA